MFDVIDIVSYAHSSGRKKSAAQFSVYAAALRLSRANHNILKIFRPRPQYIVLGPFFEVSGHPAFAPFTPLRRDFEKLIHRAFPLDFSRFRAFFIHNSSTYPQYFLTFHANLLSQERSMDHSFLLLSMFFSFASPSAFLYSA